MRTASRTGTLLDKYRYPVAVKTVDTDYMFFAFTKHDRNILFHELNGICQASNEEIFLVSTRQHVMHMINPIDAFNAYNLSMMCAPLSAE